jgi:hypothetical protein
MNASWYQNHKLCPNTTWTRHGTEDFLVRFMRKGPHPLVDALILMGAWCGEESPSPPEKIPAQAKSGAGHAVGNPTAVPQQGNEGFLAKGEIFLLTEGLLMGAPTTSPEISFPGGKWGFQQRLEVLEVGFGEELLTRRSSPILPASICVYPRLKTVLAVCSNSARACSSSRLEAPFPPNLWSK